MLSLSFHRLIHNFYHFYCRVRADNGAKGAGIAAACVLELDNVIAEFIDDFPDLYFRFRAFLYADQAALAPVRVNPDFSFFQIGSPFLRHVMTQPFYTATLISRDSHR
jgi:hypothetical protein